MNLLVYFYSMLAAKKQFKTNSEANAKSKKKNKEQKQTNRSSMDRSLLPHPYQLPPTAAVSTMLLLLLLLLLLLP